VDLSLADGELPFDAKAAVSESDAAVFEAAVFETAVLDAAEALDAETLAEAEEAKADTELADDAEFADEDELADETADDATLVLDHPEVAEETELWVDERDVEETVVELELTELELDGTLVLPELSMAMLRLWSFRLQKMTHSWKWWAMARSKKSQRSSTQQSMSDMLEADESTREDVFIAKEELKPAATDEEVIIGAEVELLLKATEELKSTAIDEEVILDAEVELLLEEELEAGTTDEEVTVDIEVESVLEVEEVLVPETSVEVVIFDQFAATTSCPEVY
jgi:hypothetical protein